MYSCDGLQYGHMKEIWTLMAFPPVAQAIHYVEKNPKHLNIKNNMAKYITKYIS